MMRACCAAPRGEARRARRRAATAPADEKLSLSPESAKATPQVALSPEQQEVKKAISPSVRASPVARSDDTDSPRNRCSSEPLGVEHLRARTGRGKIFPTVIDSPLQSQRRRADGCQQGLSCGTDECYRRFACRASFTRMARCRSGVAVVVHLPFKCACSATQCRWW